MKICTICKKEKELILFRLFCRSKDGYSAACKECLNSKAKTVRLSEKGKIYKLKYYKQSKALRKETRKKYELKNKDIIKDKYKKYCLDNKLKIQEKSKIYRLKNKNKIKKQQSIYIKQNIDKIKKRKKIYRLNNAEKIKIYSNEYSKKQKNINNLYKLKCYLRSRIWFIFKKNNLNKINTQKLIGCNFDFAKKWIESKFTKGMTWENQGDWHIDHIIPFASAKTEKDLTELCHYTNLQPLWAKDNLEKSAKIPNIQLSMTI